MYEIFILATDAFGFSSGYGRGVPSGSARGATPRPPWIYDIGERQWTAIDVLAGVCIALSSGLTQAPFHHNRSGDLILDLVAALAIAGRRRWPVPALAVVTIVFIASTTNEGPTLAISASLALVGYMVAARSPRSTSIWALVIAEAAMAAAIGVSGGRGPIAQEATESLLVLAAAWFVGDSVSARRTYVAATAEQEQVAQAERGRQLVREERVRIARELHDVVAHTLTVITVQAGVGRRLMQKDPEQACTALESIEATGRTAQDELRVVLGLLREGDSQQAELLPAPGLGDLEELIETFRVAGTPVEFRSSGTARLLSPALELSVYRIIQEALTNVVKHAPGSRAIVDLDISDREVSIAVADDGGGRPGSRRDTMIEIPGLAGSKHGIVGMHERVGAFGGTLVAELMPGSGFRVVAHIPLQPQSSR